MAVQWVTGKVQKKHNWTAGLFTLCIDIDGVRPFEPGQFLQLGVRLPDGRLINRPYSVASPYGGPLEFYIVKVDGGELTPILERLEVGGEIELSERATGSFVLSKTPPAECLWLLATGTGLAPYIAMLRTEVPWQNYRKIVLVHGARHFSELSYADELKGYETRYPHQFHYVPSTTRDPDAQCLKGRISTLLETGELESELGLRISSENSSVMLCGNPAMLDEVESILGHRGMKKHRSKSPGHIVLERYW